MGNCDVANPLGKSLVLPQSNQIIFYSGLVMHAAIHLPFASLICVACFFSCVRAQRMFRFTGWFDRLIDVTDQMPTTCIYISDLFPDTTSHLDGPLLQQSKFASTRKKSSTKHKSWLWITAMNCISDFGVNFIRQPRACAELLHTHCDIHLTLHVIDTNTIYVLWQFYLHENGKYTI